MLSFIFQTHLLFKKFLTNQSDSSKMPPRKKLHDDIYDGEEDYCPKRKIKKLDIQVDASSKIFNNRHIVHDIIHSVVGNDKSVLDLLQLRLVNKSFNHVVLSKIRAEFVQVQVSPLHKSETNGEYSDNEEAENDLSSLQDRSFSVNDRRTSFSRCANFFEFLNSVARIRVRDLLFSGFTSPDKRLHDCILYSLLAANWFSLTSYKGAEEVCHGCTACIEIASRVKVYGPVQLCTLLEPIPGRRHYEQLIVTEILLAEIAFYCVEMIGSKEEAFVRLAKMITQEISCDQLDLVFSDRCMWSKDTLAHPREVIDWIVKAWKIKSINIRFITGYSSIDYKQWACKRIFTEMRFDEMFVKDQNLRMRSDRDHFERVEVDMQAGDEIATCFAESMGMFERSGMSATAFQNVCANVKRIFPTQDMYLILPIELAHVASVEFDGFCEALLEFAWKDQQTARHSRLFFRLFTFGITEKEVMRQIEKQFRINCRPVAAMLSDPSVRCSFLKWLPGSTSTFDRSLLSFTDVSNNCVIHLEVCVEPT